MGVRYRLVRVHVFVALGQMQPNADRHQQPASDKLERQRLAQRSHCGRRAEERGG